MGVSKSLQRTTAGNAPVQELIQDGRAAELLVRRREDAAGESMTWSWRRAFFSTRISRIRADFFSCVLCVSWGTLPGAVSWPAVTVGCHRDWPEVFNRMDIFSSQTLESTPGS